VEVSPLLGQKSGTKCAGTTTKKVRFNLFEIISTRCTKANNQSLVERRRRETINEGINEIAKIVPGCEKNKGSILARAVQFITQLKDNETQNIEKWTLEKLLTEQAIAELSSSCDKLKNECQRARAECELWKKAAQKAGVTSIEGIAPGPGAANSGTGAGAGAGAGSGDAKEPVSAPVQNTVGAAVAATAANEDTE
jgi:membrane protein involved in colicin uptake